MHVPVWSRNICISTLKKSINKTFRRVTQGTPRAQSMEQMDRLSSASVVSFKVAQLPAKTFMRVTVVYKRLTSKTQDRKEWEVLWRGPMREAWKLLTWHCEVLSKHQENYRLSTLMCSFSLMLSSSGFNPSFKVLEIRLLEISWIKGTNPVH